MRQTIVLIIFLIVFGGSVFSQSNKFEKPKREITVCKVELTESGKQSSFHFNYIYLLNTDAVGAIDEIKQLHKDNAEFVQVEKFVSCMKNWKLKPLNKYVITVSFGTIAEENFILIADKEEKLKIVL